ncbi:hypothetical protein [Bacillus cereus group sp. BfR-BA-01380]|uniref:hypothetical protein n=1 Tax=Bacillus cereus group sp. BfR-BA-01380 TaxID=2920324 RepID=UPI001F572084|nr:hypothetical protein [Bacillus cereus group sp. BfR-BA-01380]
MADRQLAARVPEETAQKINDIVKEINKAVPEADVSVSAILRFAINEYVKQHEEKKGEKLFVEIPYNDLFKEEIGKLLKAFKDIYSYFENDSVKKAIEKLEEKMLNLELQELLEEKRAKQSKTEWEGA